MEPIEHHEIFHHLVTFGNQAGLSRQICGPDEVNDSLSNSGA